eukprot:1853622-Pleurochrysis_carterae.AAC.1
MERPALSVAARRIEIRPRKCRLRHTALAHNPQMSTKGQTISQSVRSTRRRIQAFKNFCAIEVTLRHSGISARRAIFHSRCHFAITSLEPATPSLGKNPPPKSSEPDHPTTISCVARPNFVTLACEARSHKDDAAEEDAQSEPAPSRDVALQQRHREEGRRQ